MKQDASNGLLLVMGLQRVSVCLCKHERIAFKRRLYELCVGVVAVSIAERLTFDERIDQAAKVIMTPSLILIWSFTDPIHPQVMYSQTKVITTLHSPQMPTGEVFTDRSPSS